MVLTTQTRAGREKKTRSKRKVKEDTLLQQEGLSVRSVRSAEMLSDCHQTVLSNNTGTCNNPAALMAATTNPEAIKLTQEVSVLRTQRKKLEDALHELSEADRRKAADLRSCHEEHLNEMERTKRDARQRMQILLETLKTKDRLIGHLQQEVRVQKGKAEQSHLKGHMTSQQPQQQQQRPAEAGKTEATGREKELRRLQEQLSQCQDKMRRLEEQKRELTRRLSEVESGQAPLRHKSRHMAARNMKLSSQNTHLQATLRQLKQENARLKSDISRGSSIKPSWPCGRSSVTCSTPTSTPVPSRSPTPRLDVPDTTSARHLKSLLAERDRTIAALKQQAKEKDLQLEQLQLPKEQGLAKQVTEAARPEVQAEVRATKDDSSSTNTILTSFSSNLSNDSSNWNENSPYDHERKYALLMKEHEALQRTYQLLQTRVQNDNQQPVEEETEDTMMATDETERLREELRECREQNELLEFRLLELEGVGGNNNNRNNSNNRGRPGWAVGSSCSTSSSCDGPDTKDVCTDTDSDDLWPHSDDASGDESALPDYLKHFELKKLVQELNSTIRCMEEEKLKMREELSKRSDNPSPDEASMMSLEEDGEFCSCEEQQKQKRPRSNPSECASFQESGIFEGELLDLVTVGTQTDDKASDLVLTDLSQEIEKLTRFKEEVEKRGGVTNEEEKLKAQLKEWKLKAQRSPTQEWMENRIAELDGKIVKLTSENVRLEEERCELEEAENDNRLECQRLTEKLRMAQERRMLLQEEVHVSRRVIDQLRNQVLNLQEASRSAKSHILYMEGIIQKYEERNFEVEEAGVELKCKLQLMEQAVPVIALWTLWCYFSPRNFNNNDDRRRESKSGKRGCGNGEEPYAKRKRMEVEGDTESEENRHLRRKVEALECDLDMYHKVFKEEKSKLESALARSQRQTEELEHRNMRLESDLASQRNSKEEPRSLPSESELTRLKQQLIELEKKESAYQETIQRADEIVAAVEGRYQSEICRLEERESQLRESLSRVEDSERRLRQALQLCGRTSDHPQQLLQRLADSETSLLDLKEKLHYSEKHEKELHLQVIERERDIERLKAELVEQEEMLSRLRGLEQENHSLSSELCGLQDIQRRLEESQLSEEMLRNRVEELELSESTLRETLSQADHLLSGREKKLKERIAFLEEELTGSRMCAQELQSQKEHAEAKESRLREELARVKVGMEEMSQDLREQSGLVDKSQTFLKAEVMKFQTLLTKAGDEMRDLEDANQLLREEVAKLQERLQKLLEALEKAKNESEQMLIRFNLDLDSKERQLSYLTEQVEVLSESRARLELDALAQEEGGLLGVLSEVGAALGYLRDSCPEASIRLQDAHRQLLDLSEIVYGKKDDHTMVPDMDPAVLRRCESDDDLKLPEEDKEEGGSSDEGIDRESEGDNGLESLLAEKERLLLENESLQQELEEKDEEVDTMEMRHTQRSYRERSPFEWASTVPSPSDFQVVKKIGSDALLVSWAPLDADAYSITAYEIYLDGAFHQRLNSITRRSKALVHGLDLGSSLVLTIQAVSSSGATSKPVPALYSP